MAYTLLHTPPFKDCVDAYRRRPELVAAAHATAYELAQEPFGNPRLQTHRVKRAVGDTFTSYIDNNGHRLIWRLVNKTIVLLLFGEHDATYRRAERLRLEINPETDVIAVHDIDPVTQHAAPYSRLRQQVGTLFMAWTDSELAEFGFTDNEVQVLRRLDEEGELLDVADHMDERSWERAYNLLAHGRPDDDRVTPDDEGLLVEAAPAGRDDDRVLERQLSSPGAAGEFVPVEPEFLREILTRPIEDWMIFLHPDQARLVRRSFSGPARVRGASGTGKTVVALHRAAHLARTTQGRVLFTTFISSLPKVLRGLMQRLAPDVVDRIEFVHVHAWARARLADQGVQFRLDRDKAKKAFGRAFASDREAASSLANVGISRAYVQEEIDAVIKGRAIASLDHYLGIDRVGRGVSLGPAQRRAVWTIYEGYQKALRRSGYCDDNDVLALALEALDGDTTSRYAAVVVDEAQDLNEVGLRLLHRLVGNRPDGLFLVGDGQQSVYPGGYKLSDAGVSVVGRSVVLRTNYRNTSQILRTALRVVEDRPFVDGDDAPEAGKRTVTILREGEAPVFAECSIEVDHDKALVDRITELAARDGTTLGDIAVLLPTNRAVARYLRRLQDEGIAKQDLRSYDGRHAEAVKVGTYLRAKGLEFKHVLVPRLDDIGLDGARSTASEDREDLLRRQLFVAMGRARDTLWLGWVGDRPGFVAHDS